MLNMPILKFEKSCNYLKTQLQSQENNKQLLLDIIANIGLISNNSSIQEKENLNPVLEKANELLQTISNNITTLEQLNLEISSITKELTDLLSDKNRNSKTKEFYIAAFSNIKHNITQYTEKFQNMENKLVIDDNNFNEFINENNFKYTFDSIENNNEESPSNTYEFTGFSINNQEASISEENIIETSVENNIIESNYEDTNSNQENTISNLDSNQKVEVLEEPIEDEKTKKIDELTNEFKELLIDLSNGNITEDPTSIITSYFKEVTNLDDNLDNHIDNEVNETSNEEISDVENNIIDNIEENNELSENDINLEDIISTEDLIDNIDSSIEDDLVSSILEENLANDFIDNTSAEDISEENLSNDFVDNTFTQDASEENIISNNEEITLDDVIPEENFENIDDTLEDELLSSILEESLSSEDIDSDNINIEDSTIEFSEETTTLDNNENIINEDATVVDNNIIEKEIDSNLENEDEVLEEITEDLVINNDNIEEKIESDLGNEDEVLEEITEDLIDNNIVEEAIDSNLENEEENTPVEKVSNTYSNLYDSYYNSKTSMEENIFSEYSSFDSFSISKFKPLAPTKPAIVSNEVKNELKDDKIEIVEDTNTSEDINEELKENINDTINEEKIEANISEETTLSREDKIEEQLKSDYNFINDISDDLFDDFVLSSVTNKKLENDNNTAETTTPTIEEKIDENELKDENLTEVNEEKSEENNEIIEGQNASTNLEEKINKIISAEADNEALIISERTSKIYLPYKIPELISYIESYPNVYSSLSDVVEQEFILPFDYFMKHPFKSRFLETYNLMRNREGASIISSIAYSLKLVYKHNLNPAIIAACKSENELNNYLYYLDSNNLKGFKFFNIVYEINPL